MPAQQIGEVGSSDSDEIEAGTDDVQHTGIIVNLGDRFIAPGIDEDIALSWLTTGAGANPDSSG
jgi:hypothetical protein